VVRSRSLRRRDFVQEGGQIEDAFEEGSNPTGMERLIVALTDSIMGTSATLMSRRIPINKVPAEGFGISTATCDLHALLTGDRGFRVRSA